MKATRVFVTVIAYAIACPAQSQSQPVSDGRGYPDRPLRYVVPFLAGSGLDVVGRIVAQKLSAALGQPVVVDNRAGAGGNIGADIVAKSAPDGHTLLHTINSLAASPALYLSLPFDPARDLTPIVQITTQPFVLVVQPSMPVKTFRELVELARERPGQLSFGSSGVGALDHLAGELLSSMAGIKMLHVPYKGGPAVLSEIMGGRITMTFTGIASGVPLVRSGKLRALAVTTTRRSKMLPDMPTVAESGLPHYEVVNSNALYAPASTPKAIIARLNREVIKIVKLQDVQERFEKLGVEAVGGTPEEAAAQFKADIVRWKKVVAEAGIKPQI